MLSLKVTRTTLRIPSCRQLHVYARGMKDVTNQNERIGLLHTRCASLSAEPASFVYARGMKDVTNQNERIGLLHTRCASLSAEPASFAHTNVF